MDHRLANVPISFSDFLLMCSAFKFTSRQVDFKEGAIISGIIEELGQTWETVVTNARGTTLLAKEKYGHMLKQHPEIANTVVELKSDMENFSTAVKTFLEQPTFSDIDRQEILKKWEEKCIAIYRQLKDEFTETLPEDMSEREKQRERMVLRVLEKVEDASMEIVQLPKDKEEVIRKEFKLIAQRLKSILLIAGKIIDKHPVLFRVLIITVICWIIPPNIFLQPLLAPFGWGPLGPVKGSVAAWVQSVFCGATVTKGSWFALTQSMGMGGSAALAHVVQGFIGGAAAGIQASVSKLRLDATSPDDHPST